jgi:FlaA1/EpsC-like NDP-sugar epimerase
MTRFMISLEEGVGLVWHAFEDMVGGELYVKKIPSMKVVEIARAIAPNAKLETIGIRPGEKLHEQMIGIEDAPFTYEYPSNFKILPSINGWGEDSMRIKDGRKVPEGFIYASNNNIDWMTGESFKRWLNQNELILNG